MDSRITQGSSCSASESAPISGQCTATKDDLCAVTRQVGTEKPLAVSGKSIRKRSVHVNLTGGHDRSGRKYIYIYKEYHEVGNIEQARKYMDKMDDLLKGHVFKINNYGRVNIPGGESIKLSHCIQWLSGVISSYLICNRLNEAEKYINFSIDAVNAESGSSYSNEMVGELYFFKFLWCSKKIRQAALVKELATKCPGKLPAQPPDLRSVADLERELQHNLEIAIKLNNKHALLAGIVYYLDEFDTRFPPCAKRGFELLELAIKKTESNKKRPSYLSSFIKRNTRNEVSIYMFLNILLYSIELYFEKYDDYDIASGGSSKFKFNYFYTILKGQLFQYIEPSVMHDYLTHKEASDMFNFFHGDRETLFKYVRISPQLIFYIFSRNYEKVFHKAYKDFFDICSHDNDQIQFSILGSIPAYREYVYVRGADRKRPESGNNFCEFDPLISRNKLNYLYIKHKMKQKEWEAAASVLDTFDLNSAPIDQQSEYVDLLIKLNRLPEALELLKVLINQHEAGYRDYELAMAVFKMEALEELLINDKNAMHQVMDIQPATREVVTADPDCAHPVGDVEPAHAQPAEQKPLDPYVGIAQKSPLAPKPEQQAAPLLSSPSGFQQEKKKPVSTFDYRTVCQNIQNEMTYGSLESTVRLIDRKLSDSTISLIHRGRLLWHKGWAYKALARNKLERTKALACFSKALSCAVRTKNPGIRDREIDPVKFLNTDNLLSQWLYPECYGEKAMSFIADIYSALGNYFRDMGQSDIGGKCSGVADHIKPWRIMRNRHQSGNKPVFDPRVRLIQP